MVRRIIEDTIIEGVPCSIYRIDDNKKRPLIFFIHGITKNRFLGVYDIGIELSRRGYVVCCIDSFLHGERTTDEFQSLPYKQKEKYASDIIFQNTKDIEKLINYFSEFEYVDTDKIGITGISLGGMTSAFALSQIPDIKVACMMIATANLVDLVNFNFPGFLDQSPDKKALMTKINPTNNVDKFSNKPLLMLNGSLDKRIPIELVRNAFEEIKQGYTDKEIIKLTEYECEHETPLKMRIEMFDWFDEKFRK